MNRRRHSHADEHVVPNPTLDEQIADLGLFAAPPTTATPAWLARPETPIERAFKAFHEVNPMVYHVLDEAALKQLAAGARRIGIAKLIEDIRYSRLETVGNTFKVNNSFRSLYARLLIHRRPELAELFVLRERSEGAA